MCITGEAGGFRDHFGAEKKKEKKTGSNVSTFQRRDVSTSRRLVNRRKSQQTSQHHDVSMSRTSSRFLPQNHKKQKRPNFHIIEEHTKESMENEATVIGVIGKDNRFVFFFSHKLLMIYRIMGAANTNML